MDELNQIVAQNIRSLIDRYTGGSTTAFASRIGISMGTLTPWLQGTSLPGAKHLTRIRQEFGVSIDWLVGLPETTEAWEATLERIEEPEVRDHVERLLKVLTAMAAGDGPKVDFVELPSGEFQSLTEPERRALTQVVEVLRKDDKLGKLFEQIIHNFYNNIIASID